MSNPLCPSCQRLDFEQILSNTKIPETGIEILAIGKRIISKRKAFCSLCRFFHQLGPDYTKNYTQHVRLFTCIQEAYSLRSFAKNILQSHIGHSAAAVFLRSS